MIDKYKLQPHIFIVSIHGFFDGDAYTQIREKILDRIYNTNIKCLFFQINLSDAEPVLADMFRQFLNIVRIQRPDIKLIGYIINECLNFAYLIAASMDTILANPMSLISASKDLQIEKITPITAIYNQRILDARNGKIQHHYELLVISGQIFSGEEALDYGLVDSLDHPDHFLKSEYQSMPVAIL